MGFNFYDLGVNPRPLFLSAEEIKKQKATWEALPLEGKLRRFDEHAGHDAHGAVNAIKKVGYYDLAGYAGCLCGDVSIWNFRIDVQCRKSSGDRSTLIRVGNRGMDVRPADLRHVAEEVLAQVHAVAPWSTLTLRYATREEDRKCECVYCGKPRDKSEYLCAKCLVGKDPFGSPIAFAHDYSRIQLLTKIPEAQTIGRETDV